MYAFSQALPAGFNPEALDVKVATDIRHHARHISQIRRQGQPGPEEQSSLRIQRGGVSESLERRHSGRGEGGSSKGFMTFRFVVIGKA